AGIRLLSCILASLVGLAQGANRNDSSCCRPFSRNLFLQRKPSLRATASNKSSFRSPPRCRRFCDRRTKTDNVIPALNRPIIQRRVNRSYAHGSESSCTLLREAGGCFAFHCGCQFRHVSRRGGP